MNIMAARIETNFLLVCAFLCGFPHLSSGFTGWEDYITSWENEVESDRMYPFGDGFLDNKGQANTFTDIKFKIPFYGKQYHEAYIVQQGHIELLRSRDERPAHENGGIPRQSWPNENYPDSPDPPLISPYYADVRIISDPVPQIYWRRLDPREAATSAQENITLGMLDLVSSELREVVLGAHRFKATRGLIVTWSELSHSNCYYPDPCTKNTFQAAVVTDEWNTFVVYNYYKLEWVNSAGVGCNDLGLPDEDNPNCFSAQAGFNAGKGREFHHLPFSATNDVILLAEISGTPWGVQGRFLYDVSHMRPVRGGCTDEPLSETDWPPEIWPPHGTMLGGNPVYISGPCFRSFGLVQEPHNIVCQFGSDLSVPGEFVAGNPSKAFCIAPFFRDSGRTNLYVSLEGGAENTFTHYGSYTIIPPHHTKPAIHLHNEEGQWDEVAPAALTFSWDPVLLLFAHEEGNVDSSNLMVMIRLMGYQEIFNETKTGGEMVWREIETIELSIQNEGYYSFTPSEHHCDECIWPWTTLPPVGVIQINRPGSSDSKSMKINSGPTSVGWYMNEEMIKLHGEDWAQEMCKLWFDEEIESTEWFEQLLPCPMTRGHAYTDYGGFIADADCEPDQEICPRLAIECRIGNFPKQGSWVSRCCYDDEDNLLMTEDTDSGSPSVKYHPGGVLPYGQIGHLPALSHSFWDRGPQTVCCKWSPNENDCVEHFLEVRPTPDLSEYKAPGHATAFGDPHYMTFDGNDFTFNGRGEYWLLRVDDENVPPHEHFHLQARLEQPPEHHWGAVNATVMTSIAMQEGPMNDQQYAKIEIRLNQENLGRRLTVLVKGQPWDFGHPDTMVQEYAGTSDTKTVIINNDPPEDNHQGNFTVVFQCGVGIQVANREGVLHLVASTPYTYFEYTQGLFGRWNDDPADDLLPQGSGEEPVDPDAGTEYIHKNYGQTWEITSVQSLFTYTAKMDWNHYRDPDFRPNFDEPGHPIWPPAGSNVTEEDVDAQCGECFVCRYDYKATMSASIAKTSQDMLAWTLEIDTMSEPILACGRLYIDHSIREFDHYLVGGQVKFVDCEEGYTLRGHPDYTCVEAGVGQAEWSPYLEAECKSNEEISKEQAQLATAIAVPICLVLIITLCVVGFIIYRRRQKKKKASNAEAQPKTTTSYSDQPGGSKDMLTFDPDTASRQSLQSFNLSQNLQPMRPPRPQSKPPHPYEEGTRNSRSSLGSADVGPSGVPNVSMNPTGTGYPQSMTRSRSYDNNLNSSEPYPDLASSQKSRSFGNNMYNVGLSLPPQNGAVPYSNQMGRTASGSGTPMYHTSHPSLTGSGDLRSATPMDLTLRTISPEVSPQPVQPWAPTPPQNPPPDLPPSVDTAQAFDNVAMRDEEGNIPVMSSQDATGRRGSVQSHHSNQYPGYTNISYSATDTVV